MLFAALFANLLWTAGVSAQDAKQVYTLQADGLACPFCAYGIEKQLGKIDGVEAIETDIAAGTVTVTMQPGAKLEEAQARGAVEAAGFSLGYFKQQGTSE